MGENLLTWNRLVVRGCPGTCGSSNKEQAGKYLHTSFNVVTEHTLVEGTVRLPMEN
jgi:hypothetical protein